MYRHNLKNCNELVYTDLLILVLYTSFAISIPFLSQRVHRARQARAKGISKQDMGHDMEEVENRGKRCQAGLQMAIASGSFVRINADFDRSAVCVRQTHGIHGFDGVSLFLLPEDDNS